ncbi:MAG TPA: hypothetical protein VFP50_08930 [Anaeromyxobacteraceae bacterium]|nr:hypothetical protein [Anaeromyxobacteraceae bacterium]
MGDRRGALLALAFLFAPTLDGLAAPAAAAIDDDLPPGAPEDRTLYTAARDATQAIVLERTGAARAQQRVKAGQLLERLEAAAARAGPEAAARLGALRARLLADWVADYDVLTRQWPVDPTRGCSYPLLVMDGAMRTPDAKPEKRSELSMARAELTACLEKARFAVAALAEATRRLEASAAEAERALAAPETAGEGT